MNKSLETLLIAVPLFIGCGSLIFNFLVQYGFLRKTNAQKGLLAIVLCLTIVSLLPFVYIIFSAPTTLIYLLSLGIVIVNLKSKLSDILVHCLLFVHIGYWLFVLLLFSSDANTWGNTQSLVGLISIPSSIVFINYFTLLVERKKWTAILKIVTGVAAAILIYLRTNGFELGEYSGDDVRFARISAIILCLFSIIEGAFLFKIQSLNPSHNSSTIHRS